MAKVTGRNQFSLAMGHRTTAKVDDCTCRQKRHQNTSRTLGSSIYVYNLRNLVFARAESIFGINGIYYLAATKQALRFASICYYRRLSFARLALKNIIYGIHVQCTWVCCILGTVYLVSVHGHGALW